MGSSERILYTTPTGGVAIVCPAEECIAAMWDGCYWAAMPPGYWIIQVIHQIAAGHKPAAAYKFARSLHYGGVSRPKAIEIIAERDCGHLGAAIEIVDIDEIPTDRTYRDAWRRSSNGGPIWIDEEHAQRIDEARMWKAYDETT